MQRRTDRPAQPDATATQPGTTHLGTADPVTADPTRTAIDVRFYELDPYGHVNHGVYLNYFEVARIELLDAIGFGLPRLASLGFHLVVVEARVRFHAPAHAGDRLVVTSRLASLRRTSAVWDQAIHRGDELIATNEVRSGITDTTGRPTAAPPELTDALDALATTDQSPRRGPDR